MTHLCIFMSYKLPHSSSHSTVSDHEPERSCFAAAFELDMGFMRIAHHEFLNSPLHLSLAANNKSWLCFSSFCPQSDLSLFPRFLLLLLLPLLLRNLDKAKCFSLQESVPPMIKLSAHNSTILIAAAQCKHDCPSQVVRCL